MLGFVYVGIYWNNHHHLLHACSTVTGGVLWANLHLLFWLSLLPFATGWMGEIHFGAWPSTLYGVVLLMAACAYWILQQTCIKAQGPGSVLQQALDSDWKGELSPLLYFAGIGMSFVVSWAAEVIYVAAALLWLIPDRHIERQLTRGAH